MWVRDSSRLGVKETASKQGAVRAQAFTAAPAEAGSSLRDQQMLLSVSVLSWRRERKSLIRLSKIPGDPSCTECPNPGPHVSAFIIYEGSFTGPQP